ncbi:MAG: segregation and condensation protein A [Marivirga sp.]
MSFEIKLPLFEGPFDLLLFFIERDELDIYDIPISEITNDFLDYLKHLEKLNLEVASEFILVAATLMRIKAKMLLPRPQIDEEGNEIDPREELIRHLLEYKKYKSVLTELSAMESDMMQKERRGNVKKEVKSLAETVNVEAELQNVDLYKLLNVFRNVLSRYEMEKNKPTHRVVEYPYTISGQKEYILEKISLKNKVAFTDLIQDNPSKVAVIFNFLAILELLQNAFVTITIGEGFNNFWLEKLEQE